MDSPEPTVIARTLKDFDRFISGGRGDMFSSRLSRLTDDDDSRDDSLMSTTKKRRVDAMTGLDVCKKFREKDGEIIELRTCVSRLESRVKELEAAARKQREDVEDERDQHKRRALRDKELVDDLHHKVRQAGEREREAQAALQKAREQYNTAAMELETKMVRMRNEHTEKCNALYEKITAMTQRTMELEREVDEKTSKLEMAGVAEEQLRHQVDEAQRRARQSGANQYEADALRLQLEQAQRRSKELELRLSELDSFQTKSESFDAVLCRLPKLEKELAKLKDDNKFLRMTSMNSELLEEKLAGATKKIEGLEARCHEAALTQARAQACKEELEKYEQVVSEECNVARPSPADLKRHLDKLRRGDQGVVDALEELRASQKSLETSRASGGAELTSLKSRLAKMQHNTDINAALIKRLQRKLLLVSKERDGLKSILSSYESELTINHSRVSEERISRLEHSLESYKQEIVKLEAELDLATKDAPQRREDSTKISSLEQRVKELEKEKALLNVEKETLELRLETRALKGDYDPTKTKVLHFENNPLSKAVEDRESEMERLEKENESLRERVRLLEEGETHNITQKVGIKVEADQSKEVQDLRDQINSMETRHKKMMEHFKKKSLDFREVVYRLVGYRVDSIKDNQYRLTNMYAESQQDYLMFETNNSELQLLETEYSASLDDYIDTYLRHDHSYPAFLSAITIDLFNKVTQNPQSPSEGEGEEEEDEEEDEEEEEEEEDEDEEEGMEEDREENNDDDLIILD